MDGLEVRDRAATRKLIVRARQAREPQPSSEMIRTQRASGVTELRPRLPGLLAADLIGSGRDSLCYSARLIRPFLELLGRIEASHTSVALHSLDLDDRIPIAVAHALLEAVIQSTGDQDLGLKAGCLMSLGDCGVLDYAMTSAATVRDAIEVARRFRRLLDDALEIRLEIEGERAYLRIESQVVLPRAASDFMLTAFYKDFAHAVDIYVPELECWFTHAQPADSSEYQRTFGAAKVRFAAPCTALVFSSERLRAPLSGADSKLHALLSKQAELMLAELPQSQSLTEKVRALIMKELPRVQPNAARVASQLRMSSRTLGRRLEDEGTNFRSLLDDLRRGLALNYLTKPQMALSEVAFLLGFSEVAAFHRAFRRWTSQTPLEYRRSRLG
jgi:AraC-like DNA-binding protein